MFYLEKKIPSPGHIKGQIPLSEELASRKLRFDEEIKNNVLTRKKFLAVVGPCSADDVRAMEQYCLKLKQLSDELSDKLLVVCRVYTSKPHTNGEGYMGLSAQSRIGGEVDFEQGLVKCRRMMIKCLEIGLPVANELHNVAHLSYLDDLVSYWVLGARSSADTDHRNMASGVETAVGVKNVADGDLYETAMSVYAVARPKTFLLGEDQVSTSGNGFGHVILRGKSENGKLFGNYDEKSVSEVKNYLKQADLCDFVVVDASHANSGKNALRQSEVAYSAAQNPDVDGVMIESYLKFGRSDVGFGISKTDACLDFESTADLLKKIYSIK